MANPDYALIEKLKNQAKALTNIPVDGGGGGGDDGGMEARISALEAANLETRDRLIKIETRMESLASKEDLANLRAELHSSLNAQTWKIISAAAALTGVVFYLAKYVH